MTATFESCPDKRAVLLGIFPEYWKRSDGIQQHLAARLSPAQKKYMYDYLDTHQGVGFPVSKKSWAAYFGIINLVGQLVNSRIGKINLIEHRRNKAMLSGQSQLQENNIPCGVKRNFAEVLSQELATEVCNPAQFLPLFCPADICPMYRFQQV